MWKVVGWVVIRALSRSVEAGCIRALVGRGASDISLISKGGRKLSLQAENCDQQDRVLSYPILSYPRLPFLIASSGDL